jgi:predicted dienelactone hydrolase
MVRDIKLFILWMTLGLSSMSYAAIKFPIEVMDKTRGRVIPIEVYHDKEEASLPVVIISHGYTVQNTEYSFLAEALSQFGYFIVSIQHDMPNDPPLPKSKNIFDHRKPMWERGVQNILFVINELKKEKPHLNFNKVILIGHSNVGIFR